MDKAAKDWHIKVSHGIQGRTQEEPGNSSYMFYRKITMFNNKE
jgi:hypothetical protein